MRGVKRWNALAILICAFLMLTACGQKGDLYLPQGQADIVKVG